MNGNLKKYKSIQLTTSLKIGATMDILTENEPKERILDLARDRFFKMGFNKVTLDEISGELGISKKTMYKFFPSKEDLVKTIVHMTLRSAQKEVERITTQDKPFVHRLAEVMMFMGKMTSRLGRPFLQDMQRFAPSIWKEADEFRRTHLLSKVISMIHQAKQENVFRGDVNEEVIVMMLTACIQNIVTPDVLSQHSFSPKEAMYTIFHVIFEGALTEESRKEFLNYEIIIL
ncbi:MAG: TetR/AcrR family transcriptional regulator [Bacteroidota bacterium]|nr:TetR/AcrR family transcriptional regulator [Bacteroidota bacterium]